VATSLTLSRHHIGNTSILNQFFWPGVLAGQLSSLLYGYKAPIKSDPFVRHIVAVGDLHGDMPNARRVLQFSGVVDEYGNWTGHADFFVQTGDIIDR